MDSTNTQFSRPALALARGKRTLTLLSTLLVISVLANIISPIYFWYQAHQKQNLVVFDLASGSLLLSPVVDPADSREILNVCAEWGAKSVLDRSPTGLDNDDLIGVLFNSETARKVHDEFGAVRDEYAAKKLRSHVEIKSIDAQTIGQGIIRATVVGQCIITGTVNGESIQEVKPITLQLSLARNPDLGKNRRYPLVVFGYQYVDGSAVAQK
jgi:hypothetical protein